MKVILSNNVKSLTGSLGRGYGYHIKHRKNGFFGERNSIGSVPPYGHWLFIAVCAELAQIGLHIVDIQIEPVELRAAIIEAGLYDKVPSEVVFREEPFNANDIIKLKNDFSL